MSRTIGSKVVVKVPSLIELNAEKTTETDVQRAYKQLSSIAGFESAIPVPPEELEEWENWSNETGFFLEDEEQTSYGSYGPDVLMALAEQGDMRAIAALLALPSHQFVLYCFKRG